MLMMGPRHSCGVVGVTADYDVAPNIYLALMIIQHRGQESAGISAYNGSNTRTIKGDGLVENAIKAESLADLPGKAGIGHVRYGVVSSKGYANAEPMTVTTNFGELSLAHNGQLTNYSKLREKYMDEGWTFFTETDAELIIKILGKYLSIDKDPFKAVKGVMDELEGSYSVTFMINGRVFGFRDPQGFTPLILGSIEGGYILVSESTAIEALRGKIVRDVAPGEVCEITKAGYRFTPLITDRPCSHCVFEWVYFARPDSIIDGMNVYEARRNIGSVLARESPVDADLVMPIPDSGRAHAIGYAIQSGIPYEEGFMKNRFAGRTFIMPEQKQRESAVSMKMIPIRRTVEGKRIIIVDDSIVRGTTLKILVSMLRDAGAKEVHVRIGCPPVVAPCYYGVDMKTREQFIANVTDSIEEIRQIIGADTLAYISYEGLIEAVGFKETELCAACVSNKYPTRIDGEKYMYD